MKFSPIQFLCVIVFCLCGLLRAELRTFTLLQTADTHAHLTPATGEPCWTRLATLIRRELSPDALLIDCGDTCQGTLAASLTQGVAALRPILTLPYDAWIPGNHELDFGPEAYEALEALAGERLLCGNFHIVGGRIPRAWRLFNRNGVRIALIGMQASFFHNWVLPEMYARCVSEKAADVLERILPEVVAVQPDAIVLATHQGWLESTYARPVNEVAEIARRFPEIDVILGAHTHRKIPGRKIGLRTWYVQPGCMASALAVVKVTVDTHLHEVTDIQSSLKLVLPDTPEDPVLAAALAPFVQLVRAEAKRDTGIDLPVKVTSAGRPGIACQTSELLCQAIAEAVGADVAIHGRLSNATLGPGPVSPLDIFHVVPYDNTIVTARITPKQLELIMAEQWRQRDSYRFCGPWNATFRKNGDELTMLSVNTDKKSLLLALNNHTAAGSGTSPVLRAILDAPEANTTLTGISTRTALERFLKRHQNNLKLNKHWIVR